MMVVIFGYCYIIFEEKGDFVCLYSYLMFVNVVRFRICFYILRFGFILSFVLIIKC